MNKQLAVEEITAREITEMLLDHYFKGDLSIGQIIGVLETTKLNLHKSLIELKEKKEGENLL